MRNILFDLLKTNENIGSYIMRIYRIISEEYEIYPEKEGIHEVF